MGPPRETGETQGESEEEREGNWERGQAQSLQGSRDSGRSREPPDEGSDEKGGQLEPVPCDEAAPCAAAHACAGTLLCAHLPAPTADSGTCLGRCQAQPALAGAQPFPGSQELQFTFLWWQHKMNTMKSPSKHGLRCAFACILGGGASLPPGSPRPMPAAT